MPSFRNKTNMFGSRQNLIKTTCLAALGVLLTTAALDAAEEPRFDPSEILELTVKRAHRLAEEAPAEVYLYDKLTTTNSLDAAGDVTARKTQLFEVTLRGGVPDARLVKIEGRDLTPKQIAKEDEKIRRRRRAFLNKDAAKGKPTRNTFVPRGLAKRFELTWIRIENVAERPTHVIDFAPRKPAAKETTFADKVANRLSGTIWIDAADLEIARLDVALSERVKLWGGVIGLLNEFTYSLVRKRSSEGVWHNDFAEIGLDARGLLVKRIRIQVVEQSSHFRNAPEISPRTPTPAATATDHSLPPKIQDASSNTPDHSSDQIQFQ